MDQSDLIEIRCSTLIVFHQLVIIAQNSFHLRLEQPALLFEFALNQLLLVPESNRRGEREMISGR